MKENTVELKEDRSLQELYKEAQDKIYTLINELADNIPYWMLIPVISDILHQFEISNSYDIGYGLVKKKIQEDMLETENE